MTIVFIGTGKFGAAILESLSRTKYCPAYLVCSCDKPVGRKQKLTPCPSKEIAKHYKIKIIEALSLKEETMIKRIERVRPDLVIVADTDFILPQTLLNVPPRGCLNVHPSLLPKYRGPSPIQAAIFWGQKETGVTIIQMDEKIDHGPIVVQEKYEMPEPPPYFEPLRDELANLGARLLIKTLPKWLAGKIIPKAQNDDEAIYTKKFKKEDGLLDWKGSAQEIERKIKALNPWPGTYTYFLWKENSLRLKILQAQAVDLEAKSFNEGKITQDGKTLKVEASQGRIILEKIQIEGKSIMTGKEFLNGYQGVKNLGRA